MESKLIILKRVACFLLLIPLMSLTTGWADELKLTSSSERGCVVSFVPGDYKIETIKYGGKKYELIKSKKWGYWGKKGEPMIPSRSVVLAIPDGAEVEVKLRSSNFREVNSVRILPIPFVRKDKNNLSKEYYKEGEIYNQRGYWPQQPYMVESPGYFGDQRIIRIHLFPIQFNAIENKIRIYSELIINVSFMGPEKPKTDIKRRNETIYKRAILNYSENRSGQKKENSVVKKRIKKAVNGEFYKIPITKEGIYKITGSFLKKHKIDIESIKPSTLKILNNGGRELSRDIGDHSSDTLTENPILLFGMDDNSFDKSDYILFYGRGVNGWEYNPSENRYEHYINHYTDKNIYWLVFNDDLSGKRVVTKKQATPSGAETVESFQEHIFLENEMNNPWKGGIHWLGTLFSNNNKSKDYSVVLRDPVGGSQNLYFRFKFLGHTYGTHMFTIKWNGNVVKNVQFTGAYQKIDETSKSVSDIGTQNTLTLQYTGYGSQPQAYIDWYEIGYERKLKPFSGTVRFFSPEEEGYYKFHLSGFSKEPLVLDVTDIGNIKKIELLSSSGNWTFTDSIESYSPRIYIACDESGFRSVETIIQDSPSDLKNPSNGADMIIVSHGEFIEEAERLKSMREEQDTLSVEVVDVEDVYDQFSGGLFDPVAIRNFIRFAFENWSVAPSYLLLFGDGSYDYKSILPYSQKNWIPPLEYDGWSDDGARASDDWYTYVSGNDYYMDLSVGRIPVQNREEAKIAVDKIIEYETSNNMGDWRNLITIVADDEKAGSQSMNEITHTRASEYIASEIPPPFDITKIYLTEYPEVITAEGRRKPEANTDLIESINRGTLFVNYIGHGNNKLWAHEWIFHRDIDFPNIDNQKKLPLFFAATCSFGWYDNPEEQSFSEILLNTENRGGIGVIASNRLCIASYNEALDRTFVSNLLGSQDTRLRVGDALRVAKLALSNTVNNEKYHLLGDPSLRLSSPRNLCLFTTIEPDTFKALSKIEVRGQIEKNGQIWDDFNGTATLKGFDSKKDVTYTTEAGSQISYTLWGNPIFRGDVEVNQGRFEASFIVPKDISYGAHTARLSCYFSNDQTDGHGSKDSIEVGGSSELIDTKGPEITIYFKGHENFVTGEMINQDPELITRIRDDKSGINITGEIGHKIMLTVDGEQNNDVTEYFHYDEGSYLEGTLQYQLTGLELGEHQITLKAWDNANNSSTQSILFRIVPREEIRIERVFNYPNPFSTSTHFTFEINQDAEIEIKIYTTSGLLIKHIERVEAQPGFNMIHWDGLDDMGDRLANGVYLYKIIAKAHIDGKRIRKEVLGRLMIIH